MTSKILAQGAEAIITLDKNIITKNRIPKSYRLKKLDDKIRESRTRKEAKILEKASKIISVPRVLKQSEYSLELEYIDGDKLSQTLNSYPEKKQFEVMEILGEETSKLHAQDIIHGDLTTSNTILKDETVFIIDFGLSFISHRTEDKAVDLHLIKQALEAKHFSIHKECERIILEDYNSKDKEKVLEQLKKVEERGRYKH